MTKDRGKKLRSKSWKRSSSFRSKLFSLNFHEIVVWIKIFLPQALENFIKSIYKGAPCVMEVIIIFSQGSKQDNRLIDNRLLSQNIWEAVSK